MGSIVVETVNIKWLLILPIISSRNLEMRKMPFKERASCSMNGIQNIVMGFQIMTSILFVKASINIHVV